MKPLSELEKKWRKEANYLWSLGQHAGAERIRECADELQAWLREANKVLDRYEEDRKYLYPSQIRLHLLGTTRQEGEK